MKAKATRYFRILIQGVLLLVVVFWGKTAGARGEDTEQLSSLAGGAALDSPIPVQTIYTNVAVSGQLVAWSKWSISSSMLPAPDTKVARIASGPSPAGLDTSGNLWIGSKVIPGTPSPFVDVASGHNHVLGLRADGTVHLENLWWKQPAVPAKCTNVVALAAGIDISLALRADGTVVGWGGKVDSRALTVSFGYSGVAASDSQYCVVKRDGRVVSNKGLPALSNVVQIELGTTRGLALLETGQVVSWDRSTLELLPLPAEASPAAQIAACDDHFLALRTDGTVLGWNDTGTVMALPSGLTNVVAITATPGGGIALRSSPTPPTILRTNLVLPAMVGEAACLSVQAQGSLPMSYQWLRAGSAIPGATNSTLYLPTFNLETAGEYRAIIRNEYGTITGPSFHLKPGCLVSWGALECSHGVRCALDTPTHIPPVLQASTSYGSSAAVLEDGRVYCWGKDPFEPGVIGVFAPGLTNIISVSGARRVIALDYNGSVWVWQRSTYSQSAPTRVANLSNVIAVAGVDGSSYLALLSDGTVLQQDSGRAPDGLENVVAIAATAYNEKLALRGDGSLVGWDCRTQPPPEATNVVAIGSSELGFVALRRDGKAVFWDLLGQNAILAPPEGTAFAGFAGGNQFWLASLDDGRVAAWGTNDAGQTDIPTGVQNVVGVTAGTTHGVALIRPTMTPRILVPPKAYQVSSGKAHAISVRAVGSLPLFYQWQKDGMDIDGATNWFHNLENPTLLDSGSYSVRILNAFGEVSTEPVSILCEALAPSPQITPSMSGMYLGGTAALHVTAGGSRPVHYQWCRDNQPIVGATNAELVIAGFQKSDVGAYTVVAENPVGTCTSEAALLAQVPVAAWGENENGESTLPIELTNAVGVCAGFRSSVALMADGRVFNWGGGQFYEGHFLEGITNAIAVHAPWPRIGIALRADGTISTWGLLNDKPITISGEVTNIIQIASTGYCYLALRQDGTLFGWSADALGGTNLASQIVSFDSDSEYTIVALARDGTVSVWDGRFQAAASPVFPEQVVRVIGTSHYFLGITPDGRVLSQPRPQEYEAPYPPPTNLTEVVDLVTGASFGLALKTDGTLAAFGTTTAPGWTNVLAVSVYLDHALALLGPLPQAPQLWVTPREANLELTLTGSSGLAYRIESASNLGATAIWKSETDVILTTNRASVTRPLSQSSEMRFYRARLLTR